MSAEEALVEALLGLPDGDRLVALTEQARRKAREGRRLEACRHLINAGAGVYRVVQQLQQQRQPDHAASYAFVAEKLFRRAVDLARRGEVAEACGFLTQGANRDLAECFAWLGNTLLQRAKYEDAEASYTASARAVEEFGTSELSTRLRMGAIVHRVHKANPSKHAAVLKSWESAIDRRRKDDPCEMDYLDSRVLLLQERMRGFITFNAVPQAFNLGSGELLAAARRAAHTAGIRRSGSVMPHEVHSELVGVCNKLKDAERAEHHLRQSLWCRAEVLGFVDMSDGRRPFEDRSGLPTIEPGKAHPDDDFDLGRSLQHLADLYFQTNRFRDAANAFEKAGPLLARGEPRGLALALHRTGVALHRAEDWEAALGAFLRSIKEHERIFGEDCAESVETLVWQGRTLHHIPGRVAESLPVFERALGIGRSLLGDGHTSTKNALEGLVATKKLLSRTS